MYSYTDEGICQFDILVPGHESATDKYSQNRIMHWAPSDSRGYVHTNARKDHHWSGEKNWPGSWPFGLCMIRRPDRSGAARYYSRKPLLRPAASACPSWTDDTTCAVKSNDPCEFERRPSDNSGIQTAKGYPENYLRSDGNCDFYAKYPGPQKNPDF